MELGYLTSKEKLTIPARLLKKYGIKPGTKVICHEEGNGIKIIPAVTSDEIYSNIGFMKTKKNLLRTLMEERRKDFKKDFNI